MCWGIQDSLRRTLWTRPHLWRSPRLSTFTARSSGRTRRIGRDQLKFHEKDVDLSFAFVGRLKETSNKACKESKACTSGLYARRIAHDGCSEFGRATLRHQEVVRHTGYQGSCWSRFYVEVFLTPSKEVAGARSLKVVCENIHFHLFLNLLSGSCQAYRSDRHKCTPDCVRVSPQFGFTSRSSLVSTFNFQKRNVFLLLSNALHDTSLYVHTFRQTTMARAREALHVTSFTESYASFSAAVSAAFPLCRQALHYQPGHRHHLGHPHQKQAFS